MLHKLTAFLAAATPQQRATLAEVVGTSTNHLLQLRGGHRKASVGMAARIEQATVLMHKALPHLPVVPRIDTCDDCAQCPHAKRAAP